MPIAKELTIRVEDTPGTLAQCCRPLANGDVNILAFQAFEREGQSVIRLVVDDPASAKKLLDTNRIYYTETEVAQVALPHRSGELFRAASLLSEAGININYAYSGPESRTNMSVAVFGVTDVAKAVSLLVPIEITGTALPAANGAEFLRLPRRRVDYSNRGSREEF